MQCVTHENGAKRLPQGPLAFRSSPDHPAIAYSTAPLADAVSVLNARLTYDDDSRYLPSVLQALRVPKKSQIAVFSPTSLQAEKIHPQNPRAVASPINGARSRSGGPGGK